jgi:hypothetical protein
MPQFCEFGLIDHIGSRGRNKAPFRNYEPRLRKLLFNFTPVVARMNVHQTE